MTKVAVLSEPVDAGWMSYRAVSGRNQAMGRTAGEALDALTALLPKEDTETLVIVRDLKADRFFSAEQRRRMTELMALQEEVRAGRASWSTRDEAELERLVEAELRSATQRAEALARELGR